MDVSDRSLQVLLTQQAKILTTLLLFIRIFAFAGFVRGLSACTVCRRLKTSFNVLYKKKPNQFAYNME